MQEEVLDYNIKDAAVYTVNRRFLRVAILIASINILSNLISNVLTLYSPEDFSFDYEVYNRVTTTIYFLAISSLGVLLILFREYLAGIAMLLFFSTFQVIRFTDLNDFFSKMLKSPFAFSAIVTVALVIVIILLFCVRNNMVRRNVRWFAVFHLMKVVSTPLLFVISSHLAIDFRIYVVEIFSTMIAVMILLIHLKVFRNNHCPSTI